MAALAEHDMEDAARTAGSWMQVEREEYYEEDDYEEGEDDGDEEEGSEAGSDDEEFNLKQFGISQALPIPDGEPDWEAGE